MHLADTFIQSDLHCIQVTVLHLISSKVIFITLNIILCYNFIVTYLLFFSCSVLNIGKI